MLRVSFLFDYATGAVMLWLYHGYFMYILSETGIVRVAMPTLSITHAKMNNKQHYLISLIMMFINSSHGRDQGPYV